MKYKSISFIENYLQTIINEEIKTIINKISNDYYHLIREASEVTE